MIRITKQGFPQIMKDNDAFYINFVIDAVKHSDPDVELTIHKMEGEIKVSIKPSLEENKKHIIENLLDAHRLFSIKIIFSKSLAISKIISYSVIW